LYARNLRHRIGFLAPNKVWCVSEKKPKITSHLCSSPRVSGQTGQKAISLQCQNIRQWTLLDQHSQTCSLAHCVPVGRR